MLSATWIYVLYVMAVALAARRPHPACEMLSTDSRNNTVDIVAVPLSFSVKFEYCYGVKTSKFQCTYALCYVTVSNLCEPVFCFF